MIYWVFLYEGIQEVSDNERGDVDKDDVDPRLVFAFSLFGLVVNGISIWSFICWADANAYDLGSGKDYSNEISDHTSRTESRNSIHRSGSKTSSERKEESIQSESVNANAAASSADHKDDTHSRATSANGRRTGNLNMISALMHVGSDLSRSMTTFVEAIVILRHPEIDSMKV